MKLLITEEPFLSKEQIRKIALAISVMTIVLYVVAMIFSLCGSDYFILKYQNEQMNSIENFLSEHKVLPLVSWLFDTLEFCIVTSFVIKKAPKWYYVLPFYAIAMIVSATLPQTPIIFYQIYPFVFYLVIPAVDQFITNYKRVDNWKFNFKEYLINILRLLIAVVVTLLLQAMILIIKAGYFDGNNHIMSLATHFVYSIEYDIALSVILFTISLYINREKGDNKIWVMFHTHGGSSQPSTKQLQKSNTKKQLTKTQKNKIRLFFIKLYFIQLGTFLLVMVLPFLLGKVFEFLVMYLSFVIARYILGFKYSLHYKKESLCVTVGVVVFGILSLVVPFFYVVLVVAILLGSGLAVLLHLSYKYKGMWLFSKVAKPDKFAEIYVLFDGELTEHHVKSMCKYKGLTDEETHIIWWIASGEKISVIAFRLNYSVKTIERKTNEALVKLQSK